ncbi:MAG TPA: MFS transporter [Candidatus Portnoybacteria bacterium]|nr:MFS transporter [Candidatus Portnoybacteria bacterium]
MYKKLKSNIWKYFLLILTNRRNYIPVLALYFLSFPNSEAQQIGLYTGIGWFAGFFLEIPSGYIADKIGLKIALILAKFSMLVSTLFFVFGNSLPYFILGSVFIAFGFAFTSGTAGAFLYNTLLGLKKEKNFGKIEGKIKANVSLVSAGMILTLPLLTKISLVMPIQIYLIFDLIGIITAISLFSPRIKYDAEDIEGENILSQLKRFKGTGFYIASIFLGIMGAFIISLSPYKEPFVISLGFPIILVGFIMSFSRIIWFIVGYNLKFLKRIKIQKLLFYEIFLFSGLIILSSQLKNPYIIGLLLAILLGYYQGRNSLIQEYYLNNFLINKRYKATMLSIKKQIEKLFQAGFAVIIGYAMAISFNFGFLTSGISMLILLLSAYPFAKKYLNKKEIRDS